MKYDFVANKKRLENGIVVWMLKSLSLKGCVSQGVTFDEAIRQLEVNEEVWLETATLYKISKPEELL